MSEIRSRWKASSIEQELIIISRPSHTMVSHTYVHFQQLCHCMKCALKQCAVKKILGENYVREILAAVVQNICSLGCPLQKVERQPLTQKALMV